jgi:hypothetical protein
MLTSEYIVTIVDIIKQQMNDFFGINPLSGL